ncbi:kinase-like domain-containing protein [Hyaloraphidium curvatum]|nr:kinase-like domain-containing protein [Hyaloraphidium curvatum]
MELCATDLEAYLHSHGPIPERSLRPILRSILSALAYLHANGVAHRDLKPSNVLLRRPEEDPSDLAVADFDAAGVCSSSPNFFFAQAPFQTIAGTPFYLAPEIVRGAAYGSEVDMWALGCIAVELATGSTPFGGAANFGELYASIELGRWGGLPAGFSAAFRDLVGRMLVVDQRERMTAAEALAHPWFWESWESRGGGRQQGPTGAGAWVTFDEGTGELRCVAA